MLKRNCKKLINNRSTFNFHVMYNCKRISVSFTLSFNVENVKKSLWKHCDECNSKYFDFEIHEVCTRIGREITYNFVMLVERFLGNCCYEQRSIHSSLTDLIQHTSKQWHVLTATSDIRSLRTTHPKPLDTYMYKH